ncbi:hypothetical protein NECAME_14539 [Necator americanus]|uniref:Uncharacterized protein n=1 Tax=Necator americanus TaxID=51031 RepID=W2SMC1_NECAM|nr:hypothetical protein NECAME_14539 [Necator americanus]ETN70765.1 hypothetical protein NECAME_14539 [Necator americanus]
MSSCGFGPMNANDLHTEMMKAKAGKDENINRMIKINAPMKIGESEKRGELQRRIARGYDSDPQIL